MFARVEGKPGRVLVPRDAKDSREFSDRVGIFGNAPLRALWDEGPGGVGGNGRIMFGMGPATNQIDIWVELYACVGGGRVPGYHNPRFPQTAIQELFPKKDIERNLGQRIRQENEGQKPRIIRPRPVIRMRTVDTGVRSSIPLAKKEETRFLPVYPLISWDGVEPTEISTKAAELFEKIAEHEKMWNDNFRRRGELTNTIQQARAELKQELDKTDPISRILLRRIDSVISAMETIYAELLKLVIQKQIPEQLNSDQLTSVFLKLPNWSEISNVVNEGVAEYK